MSCRQKVSKMPTRDTSATLWLSWPFMTWHCRHHVSWRTNRNRSTRMLKVALQLNVQEASVREVHSVGSRSSICPHCHALRWRAETTRTSICSGNGRNGNLQHFFTTPFPDLLYDLLTWDFTRNHVSPTGLSPSTIRAFRRDIRPYNCALQLASSGLKIQPPPPGGGPQW